MTIKQSEQAKAALKVFFCAVEEWELQDKQARALLGAINNVEYDEYKQGIVKFISKDILSRLAYITTIYSNLRLLYSDENIILWLKNGSEPSSQWRGNSPLDLMTDSIEGIIRVFDYLNGFRGS